MKTGLTTSVVLHAAVIGFGLVSLSAPRPFEVGAVEALPVDIVPIESITQVQKGDKKAPAAEKSAPVPTEKPDTVPDAQEVGENEVDLKTPATPESRPKEVETAEAPPPSPKPSERPTPEAESEPQSEPEPVPATETAAVPQPKQDVKPDAKPAPAPEEEAAPEPETSPDAVAETIAAEQPKPEAAQLPDTAPAPQAKPRPPQAQTAKAPERKNSEKPAKEAAARPKSEEKEFNADEIAALLNKDKPSGGGAKRSTETASLGGDTDTGGEKLSQSEMDALRGQIQRCWNIPAGALDAEDLKVSVQFKLLPSGEIEGNPEIISGGGGSGVQRAAAESARRAVARCAPYNLPADKYEAWADVIVHFDPSEMF